MTAGSKALLIAWAFVSIPIVAAVVATVRSHGWPF
jgi:hypothetical protein